MKIQLCSIGRAHESYIQEGIAEFTKRMQRYHNVDWAILNPPKNASVLSETELKKQEAKIVENYLQKDDILILLDEKGKMLSSPDLAAYVEKKAGASSKRLIFLIGGAFGVDDSIIARADLVWSLSKLVFPHMLVRLILAEQVYRAFTITKGEKYHHL